MGVISTRTPSRGTKGWEIKHADNAVGWYTRDYVARGRACRHCGHTALTAEISLDDFIGLIRESDGGHAPTSLIEKKH